jgi:hypothetical protein
MRGEPRLAASVNARRGLLIAALVAKTVGGVTAALGAYARRALSARALCRSDALDAAAGAADLIVGAAALDPRAAHVLREITDAAVTTVGIGEALDTGWVRGWLLIVGSWRCVTHRRVGHAAAEHRAFRVDDVVHAAAATRCSAVAVVATRNAVAAAAVVAAIAVGVEAALHTDLAVHAQGPRDTIIHRRRDAVYGVQTAVFVIGVLGRFGQAARVDEVTKTAIGAVARGATLRAVLGFRMLDRIRRSAMFGIIAA